MFIRTPADMGALIRERRVKLGLDQLALAQKAGTSRKWLIEVENGKPRAEIGLVLRTLKVLGIALIADGSVEDSSPAGRKPRKRSEIDSILDSLRKQP